VVTVQHPARRLAGIEQARGGGPNQRTIHYFETLAGDTSVGHSLAYCQAYEGLAGCRLPLRAEIIRGMALELERLANHTGDLGAICDDVGFLPTSAFCGRLRGDFLNATALLCGSRFGRGMVRPGGVGFDLDSDQVLQLRNRLEPALESVAGATSLMWETLSVQARLEETGIVSREDAIELGLVGVAARASGVDQDVRRDFPTGIFRFSQIPVSTSPTGDVFARAFVRALEIQRSGNFLLNKLNAMAPGAARVVIGEPAPRSLVVSMVEIQPLNQ